ncbi:hypothetical protein [Sphingomonas sp.]|uniref:hypothetical protein n=1 Tax=Sphingomonas sp. TaxID=28214 RepID=UPI00307F07D6
MPLWLDLLRTPMAAPETPVLRRMRRTWQILCLLLAASIIFLDPLRRVLGRAGPCLVAAVLIGTIVYTVLYLGRKQRADLRHLQQWEGAE